MERIIKLVTHQEAQEFVGRQDKNLRVIEKEFKVTIILRGEDLKIIGPSTNVKKATGYIEEMLERAANPKNAMPMHVHQIGPRTKGQKEYVEAIRKYDIVFGIGPAGTGKTYLAMSCAVEALNKQAVRRIILTRPAIEARGESLGFLPGDMYEKISPYLRPLYDALYDMMDAERIEKYLETGIIEVAPLAYMRGRTLNDAFIILDEAQNCTVEQMKMFLTRMGFDSKAVITADPTQSDLPEGKPTALLQAQDLLKKIEGIKFIYFSGSDVVRHPIVQEIIEAYAT